MNGEFHEIGRRECPDKLVLVYMANENGNHIVRRSYQKEVELPRYELHIFGNPVGPSEFESIMDRDKTDFLAKYWRP